MQEIVPHVFIETSYAGVTLGAINWQHGLLLIDSPLRPEDTRSWRSALLNLGGGVDRLLINLDAHLDRTLGGRAMDCTVLGHDKLVRVFRNRPVTFKSQVAETGAEWELHNGLGSIRWAPPEITFSERLHIHWDRSPLVLESHPGSATGAIWVILPEQQVAFIGDTVLPQQPPFLATAYLLEWMESLRLLLSPVYQDYILIGGRSGVVVKDEVHTQLHYLEEIHHKVEALSAVGAAPEQTESLIPTLLKRLNFPTQRLALYQQRLRWGLRQYYVRHYRTIGSDATEE